MTQGFSYSALSAAYRCNRLYQHLFIDKLKPVEPESLELHFGTALHCGINSLLEGGGSDSFGAYWDSVKALQFAKGRQTWAELQEMGDLFLSRFERLHMKHLKPAMAEQRLYGVTPGNIKIEGTPDFVGSYRGKYSVVDFKTSASRYHNDKIHTSDQLLLYAYLAQKHTGKLVEQIAYIVFVKGREPGIQTLVKDIDQDLLNQRIENVELQCAELQAKQIFSQNFNNCIQGGRVCGFWSKCHGGNGDGSI